jgi:hypothetical protein
VFVVSETDVSDSDAQNGDLDATTDGESDVTTAEEEFAFVGDVMSSVDGDGDAQSGELDAIGEEDIGEADIGEADIGEADIGEADIGEADIGDTDTTDITEFTDVTTDITEFTGDATTDGESDVTTTPELESANVGFAAELEELDGYTTDLPKFTDLSEFTEPTSFKHPFQEEEASGSEEDTLEELTLSEMKSLRDKTT